MVETKKDFMNIGTLPYSYKKSCIERAIKNGNNYIMVVCDTFDYEDFSVFFKTLEDARNYKPESMERIMGIYDITK